MKSLAHNKLSTKVVRVHSVAAGVKSLTRMNIGLRYLAIPVVFSMFVSGYALSMRGMDIVEFLTLTVYGFLFYTAPFVIFLILHVILKLSGLVIHLGYIAASLSLLVISIFWLLPPDPSGLPLQWMAYWPLSAILMVSAVGGSFVYRKFRNS